MPLFHQYGFLGLGLSLSLLGILFPYWPLSLLGILALSIKNPLPALFLGALADLVFPVPTPHAWYLSMPFLTGAFLLSIISLFLASRLRS